MDKFIELFKKVNNPVLRIVLLIAFLVIVGISILSGCATTTKFDSLNIDNFTHTTKYNK